MRTTGTVFALCSVIIGCSPHPNEFPDAGESPDASATFDGGGGTGGGGTGSGDWSAVDAKLLSGLNPDAGQNDYGLVVWDVNNQIVHQKMVGSITGDQRFSIASASKLVAGMVLLDVVGRGLLTLDSTTGDVLHWTGPAASITLRHLMSFTSGMKASDDCINQNAITLQACAASILASNQTLAHAPGTFYDYGPTHLQVAAAMAEVATGKTWAQLFAETIQIPLGLSAEVAHFTFPNQPTRNPNKQNPNIAGGMRASILEYGKILSVAFHKGQPPAPLQLATPALFDEQAKQPYPDCVVETDNSPYARAGFPQYKYGLSAWLECTTPASGCQQVSSPGAWGFTPWFDREHHYMAILGMQMARAGGGVVTFAVSMADDLKPLIQAALP